MDEGLHTTLGNGHIGTELRLETRSVRRGERKNQDFTDKFVIILDH